MGQHTSFFVMRFVVFNYYINRFAIYGIKIWSIIYVLS